LTVAHLAKVEVMSADVPGFATPIQADDGSRIARIGVVTTVGVVNSRTRNVGVEFPDSARWAVYNCGARVNDGGDIGYNRGGADI
jgi:hypothetical protein